MRLTPALALALALGCGSAPSDPTWTEDVKPILQANCIKCHGQIQRGGAPSGFRLDNYNGGNTADGRPQYGAGLVSRFVFERTHAETMPPVAGLSGVQIDTLENWDQNGAPQGQPVDSNRAPVFELRRALEDSVADQGFLVLQYALSDPDFDVVLGRLVVDTPGGTQRINGIYSGVGTVTADIGAANGTYSFSAELDDGNAMIRTVDLGSLEVTRANLAPAVAIVRPANDSLFPSLGDDSVEVMLADAEGDPLTVTVFATRGSEQFPETPIVATATARPPDDTYDNVVVSFPIAASVSGGGWRLRVEVSDGTNSRTATAGPLVFAGGTSSALVFENGIDGVLSAYCSPCHKATGDAPNDVPAAVTGFYWQSYDDVIGFAGQMFRRVVTEQAMPPRSIELVSEIGQMPAATRQMIGEWILAGAPRN